MSVIPQLNLQEVPLASTETIVSELRIKLDLSITLFAIQVQRTEPANDVDRKGMVSCACFDNIFRNGFTSRTKSFKNAINMDLWLSTQRSLNIKLSFNKSKGNTMVQMCGARCPEEGSEALQLIMEQIYSYQMILEAMRARRDELKILNNQVMQLQGLSSETIAQWRMQFPNDWVDLWIEPLLDISWEHYKTYLSTLLIHQPDIIEDGTNCNLQLVDLVVTMANYNYTIPGLQKVQLNRLAYFLNYYWRGAPDSLFTISFDNTHSNEINIVYMIPDVTNYTRRKTPVVTFSIKSTGTISQSGPYLENNLEVIRSLQSILNPALRDYHQLN